uniref:Uncharacterized protein n=1 Tax=Strigamia maritima TaxID=126957 RepID=T1JJ47_STRMM
LFFYFYLFMKIVRVSIFRNIFIYLFIYLFIYCTLRKEVKKIKTTSQVI